MISILSRIFIKNSDDITNLLVRRKYGMLCGIVGIFLNIILFFSKLIVGIISNSITITADAFNNLSDMGSAVVTLVGFKFSGQKPDKEHPFGHGRIEYVCGLIVSMAIIVMGYELSKISIGKIISPQPTEFNATTALVLVFSILVKLYMSVYNKAVAKKINSSAIKAVAQDSLNDCVATTAILIASIIGQFIQMPIDGWCGLGVSAFILYAGYNSAKETITPLLGRKPDPDLVESIYSLVMSYPEVIGVHDLIVHDYGPGRIMVSLHAEVNSTSDLLYTHDVIDNIENEIRQKMACEATIHMDPIVCDDENVNNLKNDVCEQLVALFGKEITIHDFRMVQGHTHSNLIFDVLIPYNFKFSQKEVEKAIFDMFKRFEDGYYRPVIKVEYGYI